MGCAIRCFKSYIIIILLQLSGCGGVVSSLHEIEEGSLYDLTSLETSSLELITIDGSTLKLTKVDGSFVRNQGSASVVLPDEATGTNKEISNAIPSKNMTSFVTIIPEGNSLDGSFGLIGLPNSSDAPPIGNFNYFGNAEIFINDGNALYGLTGSSSITFEFDGTNSKIDGEITSLTGKKSLLDLSCRDCPASSVVDIIFPSGSICNGNRICLNTIELRNSSLDASLTNNHELNSNGTFFGPNSSELGAVFSVNDTESGSIEIRGAFSGKKN